MPEFKVQGIHIDHPGERERECGAKSRIYLTINRGLRSGRLDEVDLTEDQIVDLIVEGAKCLQIVRRSNAR